MNCSWIRREAIFSSLAGVCAKHEWRWPGGAGAGRARVIYLYLPEDHVIYLFLLFKKSDTANLSKSQRNQLGLLAEQLKSSYAQKRQNP